MYKKLSLNVVGSALIGIILGVLLYKLFIGISTLCCVYIFRYPWVLRTDDYWYLAICLVFFPYSIYLWKKKVWILCTATFFLIWIFSLVYFQFIKYDDATSIGIDCFVVKKGNKVGIVDKWGHAITDIEFDGYASCSGNERWQGHNKEDKPCYIIGILLKDRAFYAIGRDAKIYHANQIRKIDSPYPFMDVRTNTYRVEDYCINNHDIMGYIVYYLEYSEYCFFNKDGEIIGRGEEYILNNEGILILKSMKTWFEYTGHFYMEKNERKTYVFDLGEEHGGKQVCRADDFSDEIVDLSSFLPTNYGDHSYMLVGSNR